MICQIARSVSGLHEQWWFQTMGGKKMENALDISDSCEAKSYDLLPVVVYKILVVPDVFTWTLSFYTTITFQ